MPFCFLIWCAVKSMHQARFIQLHNHNKRTVQLQLYLPATSVHRDEGVMLLILLILQQAAFVGSNSLCDGQEIPYLLGNTMFRYRTHKSQVLDPILSHFNASTISQRIFRVLSSMLRSTSCPSPCCSITVLYAFYYPPARQVSAYVN